MLNTKIIGDRIAEARKKINISQAELARRLFISPQAVGKWERGESMPDIVTFNRLAKIVGVDLNYFSESFQSEGTENTPVELSEKQSIKSVSGKEEPGGNALKNLSWDMSHGNWVDADFSGLKNLHEKFSSSNMRNCKFIDSDLSGLLLKSNHIDSCDFSGSDISNSHIQGSHLLNNKFENCTLKETEFSGSHITGCNFSGTDFTGAIFKSGGIEKSTIANAVWIRTSFTDTYFGDIIFEGILEECSFESCGFKKVKFQNATLINTFFKNNKKLKQVRFIDCKVDKITYAFLQNGNADLTGISILTA